MRRDWFTTTPEDAAQFERAHSHPADPPDPIHPNDVCSSTTDHESTWFAQSQAVINQIAGAA